jgi:TonB family protein
MTLQLLNAVAYSVQLAVLVLAAFAISTVLRLRHPLATLRFWQIVFLAAIMLPLLQPRREAAVAAWGSSSYISTASVPAVPLAPLGIDLVTIVSLAVATGIAVRLGWLALGFIRLRRIIGNAVPATTLHSITRSLSIALRANATVTLSDDVHTPATIGVRRPLILLPRRILDLSPAVQRAVIAHELVHVRRRDWLHTLLGELWCALLWFHPAARLLASRLALARETVVDQAALVLTRDRRAYAEALLEFAKPEPHLPGVTPLIGRRYLSQRISLIAQEDVMSRRRLLVTFSLAFFVAAAATMSAVSVVPFSARAVQAKVYKPGNGVSLPTVVKEAKANYTQEALKRKIQGSVFMAVVVLESGDVGDVRISQSLDAEYGLDQEAIKAMKQWKFKPGMREGKPVSVELTIQMTFSLK